MDEYQKNLLDLFFTRAWLPDETLKNFSCPNKECERYGVLGWGNIRVRAKFGKHETRLLRCGECGQTFSERIGTILADSRLAPKTIVDILKFLGEGKSQRAISRVLGVDRGTVARYTQLAEGQPQKIHDELVAFLSQPQTEHVQSKHKLDPKKKRCENVAATMGLLHELFQCNVHGQNRIEINVTKLMEHLPYLNNKCGNANRKILDNTLNAIPGIRYTYVMDNKEFTFGKLAALRLRKWRYSKVMVAVEYDGNSEAFASPLLP